MVAEPAGNGLVMNESETSAFVSVGNLELNLNTFEAFIDGLPVELSYNEFELLTVLASERDRVISYEAIVRRTWKESGHGSLRHLHVIIHRLRNKLAGLRPYEIRTVRGRGYGLVQVRSPQTEERGASS